MASLAPPLAVRRLCGFFIGILVGQVLSRDCGADFGQWMRRRDLTSMG